MTMFSQEKHPICNFFLNLSNVSFYEDDNVPTKMISHIVNFTNEKDYNFKFGTDL